MQLLAIEIKTYRDGPTALDVLLELVSDLLARAGDRGTHARSGVPVFLARKAQA